MSSGNTIRIAIISLAALALCLVFYYYGLAMLSSAVHTSPTVSPEELGKNPVSERGLLLKISTFESVVRGAFFAISARLTNDNPSAVEFSPGGGSFSLLVSKGKEREVEVPLPVLSGTQPQMFPSGIPARDPRLPAPQILLYFDAKDVLAALGKGVYIVRLQARLKLTDSSSATLISNPIKVTVPESSSK